MAPNNGRSVISVDIGTTHVKAILYDIEGAVRGQASEQCLVYNPRPGCVEQDADEVFLAVATAIGRLVDDCRVSPAKVAAVVFDGIWQSLLPVGADGRPLCRASTWADSRAIAQTGRLRLRVDVKEIKRRTGCALHPMYWLPRLLWLKEELPELYGTARRFISLKEYVLTHVCGSHLVDYSIASGTGIWNVRTRDWDSELLAEIGLSSDRLSESVEPTSLLPGLKRSFAEQVGLRESTPVIVGAADGACSHLGSVGLAGDKMSLTVGTGAALRKLSPVPAVPQESEAWCYYLAEDNWLVGGVLQDAGNVMSWFADELMPRHLPGESIYSEMNRLASEVSPGAEGLRFLPYLGGERCPHARPDATGVIHGLTFAHQRRHFVRAMMEGLAFTLYSVYQMLTPDSQPELVVTGGILKSPVWLQIVADVFGKTLWLPRFKEAAALGGAILALKAIGAIDTLDTSSSLIEVAGRQLVDSPNHARYRDIVAAYDRLYGTLYGRDSINGTKEVSA